MPRIRERKSNIMILLSSVASVFLIGCISWLPAHAYTVFFEDFDPEPQPGWYVDNGVWEVGVPTYGPDEAFSSPNCAGTVLSGNYPGYTDSRLISPIIELPNVSPDEEIWVRFWQWFSYSAANGTVQIQTLDDATGWTTISTSVVNSSPVWSPMAVNLNLTEYAGHSVRIAFLHTAVDYHTAAGWYVDDVAVVVEPIEAAPSAVDFESGWDGWWASNGVWEMGWPTVGPETCHDISTQCTGTVLGGNYPGYTDSRLVSPTWRLPEAGSDKEIWLRFWQWFAFSAANGVVQVQALDEATGIWSSWTTESTQVLYSSPVWSPMAVELNLSKYAGRVVRIGFLHTALDYHTAAGWYIDEVTVITRSIELIKVVPPVTVVPIGGGFEPGWGGWLATNGVWEVGLPTVGPSVCYEGVYCAGTVLGGNYPGYTDTRLVTPTLRLPDVGTNGDISLWFWHWFDFAAASGTVQVLVRDDATGLWSSTWETVGSPSTGSSVVWTPKQAPLNNYAGRTVRIGFLHTALDYHTAAGWYVDAVEVQVVTDECQPLDPTDDLAATYRRKLVTLSSDLLT